MLQEEKKTAERNRHWILAFLSRAGKSFFFFFQIKDKSYFTGK